MHGVTGVGKTFIIANVIASLNRPTLILAPNKTLAAQLYNEFATLFPNNAVEYFVSHFKHFRPEAYLPASDKFIAKSSSVDPVLDRLRHAATRSLFERSDTIVIASVSCIYGLGLPAEYLEAALRLRVRTPFYEGIPAFLTDLRRLGYTQADRTGLSTTRGLFHHCDSSVFVSAPWEPEGIVYCFDFSQLVLTHISRGPVDSVRQSLGEEVVLYPARHFATPPDRLQAAIHSIETESAQCVQTFLRAGDHLAASRLESRVSADIRLLRDVGFCPGMENYSLYLSGRSVSCPPETLLDYLPPDALLFIDESHITLPQLAAMHSANRSRKLQLIRHGFRLPSCLHNRPLTIREFWDRSLPSVFVSATPGSIELARSGHFVTPAIIRPTGILDPSVEVVPTRGQIDHLLRSISSVVATGGKALVTTLTKRMAEDLAVSLSSKPPVKPLCRKLRVTHLHSGIDTVGRMHVLQAVRQQGDSMQEDGEVVGLDVIVGVNLLREGIDLPAVQLVAILDADCEGFLRGERALVQTIGRAARNVQGHVIMYADAISAGMRHAIGQTVRRRRLQSAHNRLMGVRPMPVDSTGLAESDSHVLKRVRDLDREIRSGRVRAFGRFGSGAEGGDQEGEGGVAGEDVYSSIDFDNLEDIETHMLQAAGRKDFEMAALLRDRLTEKKEKKGYT